MKLIVLYVVLTLCFTLSSYVTHAQIMNPIGVNNTLNLDVLPTLYVTESSFNKISRSILYRCLSQFKCL